MDAAQGPWKYIVLFSIAASLFAEERRNTTCTVTSKCHLSLLCFVDMLASIILATKPT